MLPCFVFLCFPLRMHRNSNFIQFPSGFLRNTFFVTWVHIKESNFFHFVLFSQPPNTSFQIHRSKTCEWQRVESTTVNNSPLWLCNSFSLFLYTLFGSFKKFKPKIESTFPWYHGLFPVWEKFPFCLSQNNFETVSFDDSHIRPEALHLTQLCLPLDFSNSAFSIFLFYPLILLDSLSYPNALSSVLERVLGTLQSSPGVEKWSLSQWHKQLFF